MVTDKGYHKRTYEEILNAKIKKAEELFGEDINTDSNTPLGKYIRINAYDQYNVEAAAEKIYYSINPQTASGQSLDRLGWTVGISRKSATHAVCQVLIVGTANATIRKDFKVSTEAGLTFHAIREENSFDPKGELTLLVECDEAGTVGNIDTGDIVKIITPDANVDEITASELHMAGEDEESDADFLKRYEIARDGKGSCNEAAIKSALLNIQSVKDAYVKTTENEADGNIPAHSIACYVYGGYNAHQEIAEAIFSKKPAGVRTWGTVRDEDETLGIPVAYGALSGENAYRVHFSHVEETGVYIKIEVEVDNTFDSINGNESIKTNIMNYMQNMDIGETLVLTALYASVYKVTGVTKAVIKALNGDEYGTDDISIEPFKICTLSSLIINEETVYTDEI